MTRAGTNRFQGSAYYFGRNEALNGTNYFLAQAGKPKEQLAYHDFGFTVGGPIVKDTLHFFVSEEWNRSTRGTVRSRFVPTAAERAGDFSGPAIPGCTPPVPVDPLTGEPFSGDRIPSDRLSPGGLLLLQLYSLPNTTPTGGSCNNWVESVDSPTRWRQDSVRVDWSLGKRTRLLLRYTQDSWQNGAPADADRLWGSDPFPAVDVSWKQPSRSLVVQLSRDVGTAGVNTFQFSWSGNRIDVATGGTNPELAAQLNAAIPTVYPASLKYGGLDHAHPGFWGRAGIRLPRERVTLEQPDGPAGLQGRLLGDVRQAPPEGGRALQLQSEERSRVVRIERGATVRVGRRPRRIRADHRQRRGGSAVAGHDVPELRSIRKPLREAALAEPGGLRLGLVEGPPASHARRRVARVLPGQPLHHRRRDHELRTLGLRSRARQRPVQRPAAGAGKEPVRGGRVPRGSPGAKPGTRHEQRRRRSARGRGLGRVRQGQDGAARWDRTVLPAGGRRPESRARQQPALRCLAVRHSDARHQRRALRGLLEPVRGVSLLRTRGRGPPAQQLAVEPDARAAGVAQRDARARATSAAGAST